MGRAAVRLVIKNFFTKAVATGTVPYIGIVYLGRTYINDSDYETTTQGLAAESVNGSSGVLIVNIEKDNRVRVAMQGRTAVQDRVVHYVVLELFFANVGGTPLVLQTDYDQVIDAIVRMIRDHPVLTAPTTIFSAGEFQAGVDHEQSAPYTGPDGTTAFIAGTVRFEAWEWEAGTGV